MFEILIDVCNVFWTSLFQLYRNYIEHHEEIITELESATRRNKRFEQILKEFESQKVCYLPLNTFLLKPAQRLLHYKLILESKFTKSWNRVEFIMWNCRVWKWSTSQADSLDRTLVKNCCMAQWFERSVMHCWRWDAGLYVLCSNPGRGNLPNIKCIVCH